MEQKPQEPIVDTPKVDEQETVVTLKREEYDKLVEELATNKQDKVNLVTEVKDVREKKTAAENRVRELEEKPATPPTEPQNNELTADQIADIASKSALAAIGKEKQEAVGDVKEDSIEKFKTTHSEFHPDNDPAGLKYRIFSEYLDSRFNLSNATKTEEFDSILGDAYQLFTNKNNPKKIVENENQTPYSSTPSSPSDAPVESKVDNLTSQEKKLIERTFGGDESRYMKIKAKRPEYVEELLRWA